MPCPINRSLRLLFSLAMILVIAAPVSAQPAPFAHFITRKGDQLMDGTRPWRAIGVNMPGLVVPYDFTLRLADRLKLADPWEQEDALKTLVQMNARVVRTWNLPMRAPKETGMEWAYVQEPGVFNDESFKCIDNLIALADKHNIRVIIPLSADAGDYLGGIGTYAAHRQKKRGDFWTDAQIKADFKETLKYVLNRKNTITGRLYKDEKAILGWQFGNEMRSQQANWAKEMAEYVKSIDANHLLIDSKDDTIPAPEKLDPNIDVYTRHYYGGDWLKNLATDSAKLKGHRPFMITEFGLSSDVEMLKKFLDAVISSHCQGVLIWSMYFHDSRGGFKWHQIFTHPSLNSYHWPGHASGDAMKETEIVWLMREKAFAIQGISPPPLPVPEAPVLLPIGEIPLLNWKGSAGATGYDIERSPRADGPWQTLAANVSDADTAYRPLFSDITATVGQEYYYRISAVNRSGRSPASNVVGPVKIAGLCLADEFKDWSLVQTKAGKWTLVNDHNAFYCEFPYRAKGDAGDSLTYATPTQMQSIQIVAFVSTKSAELKIETSPDGREFAPWAAAMKETPLRGAPGKPGRIMMQYIGAPPAGTKAMRITLAGPTELDRVEILYR